MEDYENMHITEVQRLANQGDKNALFEMRYRQTDDDKFPPVVWQAYWDEKAAVKGHRAAMYLYADFLRAVPFPVKDCKKALEWYDKFEKESRKVGKDYAVAYAKIESGIILCEGLGLGNLRDHEEGVRLIKEGEEMMKEIGEKPNASQLLRIGEIYGLGYAQEYEDPSAADFEKAIEYLEEIKRGNFDPDGAGLTQGDSEALVKYLNHWKSSLPNKRSFGQHKTELAAKLHDPLLGNLAVELKDMIKENDIEHAKIRREEFEQPTEEGLQVENFLCQLQERFGK